MKVLHLSTSDANGGAARAAHRVHTGLRRIGVDSAMLVLKRTSGDPTVTKLTFSDNPWVRFRRRRRAAAIKRDFALYEKTLPADFEWFSDDRAEPGYDLVRRLPPCDLINLHWVGGFVDYELLFKSLPKNVPVVWRLADMGALTGGCHYDGGCGKFTATCGACPVLGSTVDDDLSRQVWKRKHAALSRLDPDRLHLIGTSRWIAGEARRSSLYGRFPVTVIPNGLDTEQFSQRDKVEARYALGVPLDKKVVLFIADSAASRRKGFAHLAAALAGLTGRSDLFLLSVGGGQPDVPGLPGLHLGRVSDDQKLSTVYNAADVFVIPSLQESFGQTVTESMACGTPVVGFDTGGIPDMVRPGITGHLAPVGDADALRAALIKTLDDPAALSAMSVHCRRIAVDEYSLAVQANAYKRFYQTLIR